MFSSALKSFTSNISSNYSIAPQPSSVSGPWKIFDAKKKSTGKPASVFIFDKKSLEPPGGGLTGRSGNSSTKRAHEEVLERLRKEASSLARLRHPSVLELAEPLEETRNGGLMFATEPIIASLGSLLADKDDEERSGNSTGRGSRYASEEADGARRPKRDVDLDELEMQKGLLQIAKGLEFLHQSAGLVHANLTPECIFVNAKSDWKITGLAFAGPPSDASSTSTTAAPLMLAEALNHDPRLPRSVQLDIDYTSPDFVLDNNVTYAADMFSLGLLIVALYNSPHRSPIDTNGSLTAYRRIFSTSSTVPTHNNNFMSAAPLPKKLSAELLPRLITRRPAQRLTATAFQQAPYFDNILISTIRFLDALPAKTPKEKAQFMRGLPRIMPQFPNPVLEKKLLPALLEEMKDRDLLAPILLNVFAIVKQVPSGKRAFTDRVIPRLREIFSAPPPAGKAAAPERDTGREAGLMIVLENMNIIAENCSGKEFRDDILPIIVSGLSSSTHALVDAALSTLPAVLPVLDYSTIKNELFPTIASVFAHTNSLAIKIRGLEAFYTLCGGTDASDDAMNDGLDGIMTSSKPGKTISSTVLDKYTVQEKIVPLLKGIKTKEPGVMMAALNVFKQVGKVADSDFLAFEVLPILWNFSLGPLLDLQQFQAFMTLIKTLSSRIEQEQTRKLQDLSASEGISSRTTTRQATANATTSPALDNDLDFESLVTGRKSTNTTPDIMNDWGAAPSVKPTPSRTLSSPSQPHLPTPPPWSSTPTSTFPQPPSQANTFRSHLGTMRTVTPDQSLNSAFAALTPSTPYSQPLQPSRPSQNNNGINMMSPQAPSAGGAFATPAPALAPSTSINWSSAMNNNNSASAWAAQRPAASLNGALGSVSGPAPARSSMSAFSIPPPPVSPLAAPAPSTYSSFSIAAPSNRSLSGGAPVAAQKQGLDKYESLL